MKIYTSCYTSPIGPIEIRATDMGMVTSVLFVESETRASLGNVVTEDCKRQLDEYFKGKRREFSIPYQLLGTDFQKTIWNKLGSIEYGTTMSYSDLAEKLRSPKGARAIGNTNGKNCLLILLPCHRVVGQDGSLTGYAGGLWRKKWLLDHESQVAGTKMQLGLGF